MAVDLRNEKSKYDIPGGYGFAGGPSTYVGMQSQFGPGFYDGYFGGFIPRATPTSVDPHISSLNGNGYYSIPHSRVTGPFGGGSVIHPAPLLDNHKLIATNPSTYVHFDVVTNRYSGGVGPNDGFY